MVKLLPRSLTGCFRAPLIDLRFCYAYPCHSSTFCASAVMLSRLLRHTIFLRCFKPCSQLLAIDQMTLINLSHALCDPLLTTHRISDTVAYSPFLIISGTVDARCQRSPLYRPGRYSPTDLPQGSAYDEAAVTNQSQ